MTHLPKSGPTDGICDCTTKAAVVGRCIFCGRLKGGEMAKRKQTDVLNIPVAFGNVGIGDGTARVGVTIDREVLNPSAADDCLCGKRLSGRIIVTNGSDPDQKVMFEGTKHELIGTFDVKGYRVSPKAIAAGLTFALASIKLEELAFFAKKTGRLIVSDVQILRPVEEEDEDSDEDDEE